MIKPNITKRKFYGKWLYKTSLRIPGVAILRMYSLQDVITFLNQIHSNENLKYSYHKKAYANREIIISLCTYLQTLHSNDWFKRIEVNNIDLYTNNQDVYKYIVEQYSDILLLASEPDSNRVEEYEDHHHIVCDKLPHNKYRYKVYLKPHKMKNDRSAKLDYINWLNQQNAVKISAAVKDWFIRTEWNWDRRYILVEDHKTLLFLHMRNSEALGKVYEYILADK